MFESEQEFHTPPYTVHTLKIISLKPRDISLADFVDNSYFLSADSLQLPLTRCQYEPGRGYRCTSTSIDLLFLEFFFSFLFCRKSDYEDK